MHNLIQFFDLKRSIVIIEIFLYILLINKYLFIYNFLFKKII